MIMLKEGLFVSTFLYDVYQKYDELNKSSEIDIIEQFSKYCESKGFDKLKDSKFTSKNYKILALATIISVYTIS